MSHDRSPAVLQRGCAFDDRAWKREHYQRVVAPGSRRQWQSFRLRSGQGGHDQFHQDARRHVWSSRHSRQLAHPGSHDHRKKQEMLDSSPSQTRNQKSVYPMGSPALPEQVADAMLFLASDESMAVIGHNLVADRGATAQCPVSVPFDRSETNLRELLEAQGSGWLEDEI